MIKCFNLLQYLSETTYRTICCNLGLDDSDSLTRGNEILYPDKMIFRVHPFNIIYDTFGHTWFLSVDVDYQKSHKENNCFEETLFSEYRKLFGQKAMADFPAFFNIYCGYIEYTDVIKVVSSHIVINNMAAMGCPCEQLDEKEWAKYKKPHATIEFCVSEIDSMHIKVLARCHGAALKKPIKDTSLHHIGSGVSISKMIDEQTEGEIMSWLYKKHKITIIK